MATNGGTPSARRTAAADPSAGMVPFYRLKVTLKGIRPPIWRRLRVAGTLNLEQLHLVIQNAMGWSNYHLFMFSIGNRRYGEPGSELQFADAAAVTLCDVLPSESSRCVYEYDFGDDWKHDVVVEAIEPGDPAEWPACLAGRRACPPEDCGGIWGYARLLQVLGDPSDPEHDEMRAWAGGDLDPEHFDLTEANRRIREEPGLRPRRQRKVRKATEPAAARAEPQGAAPLRVVDPQDAALVSALVDDEVRRRTSPAHQADATTVEAATASIVSQAFAMGIRALAQERGITVPASSGKRR